MANSADLVKEWIHKAEHDMTGMRFLLRKSGRRTNLPL
jgi:hypothetical protein